MAFRLAALLESLGFLAMGASLAHVDLISRKIADGVSRRYIDLGVALWARPWRLLFQMAAIALLLLGTFILVFIPGSVFVFMATLVTGQRSSSGGVPLLFGAALVGMLGGGMVRRRRNTRKVSR